MTADEVNSLPAEPEKEADEERIRAIIREESQPKASRFPLEDLITAKFIMGILAVLVGALVVWNGLQEVDEATIERGLGFVAMVVGYFLGRSTTPPGAREENGK